MRGVGSVSDSRLTPDRGPSGVSSATIKTTLHQVHPRFDPVIAALAQLVRDRWAAEGLGDQKVVALRPHQSEGATVTKRRRRQRDLAR